MAFTSFAFLEFLAAVLVLYFCLPARYRWMLLLVSSYFFYACWGIWYPVILLVVTTLNFVSGLAMDRAASDSRRRLWFLAGLCSSLGILAYFKYLTFLGQLAAQFLHLFSIGGGSAGFQILLPVGISFYTLQALNYTIDVYRRKRAAETDFGTFALYVSFFPQILSGPIGRSTDLLPQFHATHRFDPDRFHDGLRLIVWGFLRKLVVADRLAIAVNSVYGNVAHQNGTTLLFATYIFAFQVYYDFSAYTDIARGVAKLVGIDLMENFNHPYRAKSVNEFWKRWHISLTSWFKDYLWMVLRMAWYYSIPLVFLVSGLWHGAGLTYLTWGALNGLYLVVAIFTIEQRNRISAWIGLTRIPKLRRGLKVLVTFHLILFGWIFFRAESIADAVTIIGRIAGAIPGLLTQLIHPMALAGAVLDHDYGITTHELGLAIIFIVAMELLATIQIRFRLLERLDAGSRWIRWPVYYGAILTLILFGTFHVTKFIYAQF